jgi:hypothetical protein
MDNFENQDLGGLPVLKKETPSQKKDLGGLPILKKKEPTPSGFSVTPSPSQNLNTDEYIENKNYAKFGTFEKMRANFGYLPELQTPIASAIKKDTQKDENTAAGVYNTLVGSIKRLAGGVAYAGEVFLGGRPEATITRLAGAANAQQKTEQFIEKARSEKSSKQYEEAMGKYDFTPKPGGGLLSGVDADDFRALVFTGPSQALDLVLGGLTYGSSFVAQSISDAANEINQSDSGKKLNDAQKATYIFTQAAVQAALEKVSLDLILKNTGLGKAAKQKIANEITDEFVKKGIKATAKDIEEAAFKKASTFANKAKRVGIKAVAGVATEGTTEGTQTAAQEGIKLLTNKIVDKDVFNEDDIIANLGKNIINSSIGGAAFGGVVGGGVGVFQNTNKAIRDEVAKAGKKYFVNDTEVSEAEFNAATGNKKVVSDITKIQDEISKQVEEGNITPQEAQAANITAQQYAEIAGKIPTTVSPQDKYRIIGGIEQREALNARKQQAYDELTNLDPVFRKEKQDQIDLIQAKIDETNDYLEGIVSGKKPEYKEKRGMYFKVDSEGNETPINKETYDLAKSIREEDERKAKEPVDTTPAVIMPEENIPPQVVEPSKGPAVIMPQENVPAETTVISPEQQGKGAAVIMPEANVAPEVAETVVTEEVAPVKVKPEVKSKLESFKTKFAPQPKEVSISAVSAAQKRVNRQEAAKIAPTDARGFALSWMNQSPDALDWNSIKDLFGGRRARLNVKEVTPEEIAKRDYVAEKEGDEKIGKNGKIKGIDDVVSDIWNNLPEGLEDRITTEEIKNELERLISEYPTRADAARALIQHEGSLKGKSIEEQQLAFEERKGIEEGEEMAPVELEGGFVPFEEDMDIEGMEEPPFAVQEATTEEVAAMQDIVKDYIDDGTTSLSEIKKAIAKELGYNTKKLRQTIEDAYTKYTITEEAAVIEVKSGLLGRIGNAFGKMFGKEAQKPFISKDGKALVAKLKDIREDVRFQIEAGFRGTNDMPVAYRYDTDKVARERFDIPKLKKIGEGSDRVVFDLKDGKVLKIAKTPRGLEQNIYEGDYYLAGTILPETFERGLNYVVVEKISPAITRTIDLGIADINIESDKKGIGKLNDLLKKLKQFTQKDFDNHNGDLQDVLAEYDLTDIMNYDVIWNDFTAKRNWGLKDGEPLHLDGGTFGGIQMLDRFKGEKPLSDPEFRDIYNRSKNAKIENKDVDKFTKFMANPNASLFNKISIAGEDISEVLDYLPDSQMFLLDPIQSAMNLNEKLRGNQFNVPIKNLRKNILNSINNAIEFNQNDLSRLKTKIISKEGDVQQTFANRVSKIETRIDKLKYYRDLIDNNLLKTEDISINGKPLASFPKFMAADLSRGVEKQKIIDKAKQDGTFMKAPNGKKSNLNEEQWVSVRTKEFKNWFGDWEGDSKNSSKVVDDNGEPKVIFHGTNVNFDKFDKEKLGSKNWMADSAYTGFFFAGDEKTSQAYVGMNNADWMGLSLGESPILTNVVNKYKSELESAEKAIKEVSDAEIEKARRKHEEFIAPVVEKLRNNGFEESFIKEFAEFKRIGSEVFNNINKINKENGNAKKLDDVKEKIFKEVEKGWLEEKGLEPIILKLFLNIRNPFVFNFKNNEDTEGLTEKIKAAKLLGNDGVIFNNLADGAEVDDIFVAFEPNQIKSAEKNTGTYAIDDERINFMSDSGILGFTYKNKMYLNGEKLNPNTIIHEAGHIWVEWTKTNDPKIYAKGMELVEGSPYLKKVKDSKFYQQQAENMTDAEKADYFKNEALAMAIGDKGAQFVVESKKDAFKDWLKTLWNKIKSLTGFKDLTEEQFQNLTFEEFSKMAVKEILGVENDLDKFQAVRSMKKKKDFVKGKVRGEANKRAIDDFDVEDMVKLIKADYDLQTLKNIKDAIQKRSAEEVLPSQPRKTREARGERKRVEPRVEGDEAAGEGEDAQPEGIEKDWEGAITIAANEERRQMLGLPEYQRQKQSFEEWTNKAIKMIKKGYNVEKLLDKMEKNNYVPTPEENQIRKIYVAKLKSDYDKNPSAELEKKLIRYTEINDIVNSAAGRQLRSLADVTDPRETLADYVIAKMEANGVDELTDKQRKEVEKQYKEVKKKEEEKAAKFEINEELNTQLLAEGEIQEVKKARKPYEKSRDYKAERKSVIEEIKRKWKEKGKPTDVLLAVPLPFSPTKAKQLYAIAPDVSKLMTLYVEEGVDNLKEITSRIYVDLRNEIDGLEEKDIQDVIAGRYKRQKPLLSQIQLKKAELKKEADLIAQIEDVMAGKMPTNEKAKIEQNQKLTNLRNQLRDIKKEFNYYDLSKLNSLKERNLKEIEELDEKIKNGNFEKQIKAPSFLENPQFKNKYPKEYDSYLTTAKELSDKKHEFEVLLAKDEVSKMNIREKITKKWWPEFKSTLEGIKATADNSFIFIQLGPSIWQNPSLLPKVLNEQRKVIFNEGRFRKQMLSIYEDKEFANLIKVSGLDILDPQSLREKLREEQLGGVDFLERGIDIKGKKYKLSTLVKAPFERIAVTAGNYVRIRLFLEEVAHLQAQGKTIETHEKEYKEAARIANELTARGEMSEEFQTGIFKTLAAFTWAPKMLASTLNLLGLGDIYNYALGRKGYYASLSPELRKTAIAKMATAITVPYLIMAAIALDDDFEVDYDPRSVTFGQLKQISTGDSWNPYGRFTSVVRYLLLMMLGVRYINDEQSRADFKTETFKFFRGKMSPAYGLSLDLIFRETFDGQPLSFEEIAKDAVTPLALKDLKTYLQDDGTLGLITKGLPAISGIKVGTEKQFNQAKQPLEDIIKKHARTDDTYYSFELKNPTTKEIATKEQFEKFVKERDRLIAEKLTDLYNGYVITDSPNPVPFVSLEANEASKQISTAKTESTKEAKEIVFGKKKKSVMERLIERKRRMLRR